MKGIKGLRLGLVGAAAIAVALIGGLILGFANGPSVHAVGDTGQLATNELMIDGAVVPDIGISPTQFQRDGAGVTFDDNGITTTVLATDGTIAGGADPGTGIAPATMTDNGVSNGVIDYSAIPIVGDRVSTTATIGIAITMIMIGATLAIGALTFTRSTRRHWRAGQLNTGFAGDGTDSRQWIREMGRVPLNSIRKTAQTIRQFASTLFSTEEKTQATTRSSTA